MNEQRLAEKIRQHLNQGLGQLDAVTLTRLRSAREQALAAHKERWTAFGLALGGTGSGRLETVNFGPRFWVLVSALVLSTAIAVTYWQTAGTYLDNGDVDTALLAGDLPVRAYLDPNFYSWLKHSDE